MNALATAELYDPDTGTFTPTGDMTMSRSGHTATLLPDGRVLITGGGTGGGQSLIPTNSAEIYDSTTGTFTATGNMISTHSSHQAVLLNNGKVLLTGGSDLHGVGARHAELFDPVTGTFSSAGPYTNDNFDFSTGQGAVSTLLSDGTVLIVWEESSAELYDPVIGAFTMTDKPVLQGYNDGLPTATLLTNGKVLLAGGASDVTVGPDQFGNTDAELYDPWTGTFTATGQMITGHTLHTATLLPDGTVLIAGDFLFPGESASAELYDPATGAFTATASMVTARGGGQTATLLNDGQVLVAGGTSPYPSATARAELYHPVLLVPAPVLLSLPGDGRAAIQHAGTYQLVSAEDPAVAGEVLVMYSTGLIDGSVIPPQVSIGGRMAQVLWFGSTPGFAGLIQINVRVPSGVTPGMSIPVRLIYIGRSSNEVTIAIH